MVDLDSDPTKLIEIVEIGKQLLITRGALTTFSIANDVAKYFAIIPAMFAVAYPGLDTLNIMRLSSPNSAILSAIIFNALIIVALVPLALKGVRYRPVSADRMLRRNLTVYGLGGLIAPFLGIKPIDLLRLPGGQDLLRQGPRHLPRPRPRVHLPHVRRRSAQDHTGERPEHPREDHQVLAGPVHLRRRPDPGNLPRLHAHRIRPVGHRPHRRDHPAPGPGPLPRGRRTTAPRPSASRPPTNSAPPRRPGCAAAPSSAAWAPSPRSATTPCTTACTTPCRTPRSSPNSSARPAPTTSSWPGRPCPTPRTRIDPHPEPELTLAPAQLPFPGPVRELSTGVACRTAVSAY